MKTYESLIELALTNAGRWAGGLHYPRWKHVAALFDLNQGEAGELCRDFGLNPDEIVGQGSMSCSSMYKEYS